jgi:hypothetical protein
LRKILDIDFPRSNILKTPALRRRFALQRSA